MTRPRPRLHDYVWLSEKTTPAMHFWLANGPVKFENIIYWTPKVP